MVSIRQEVRTRFTARDQTGAAAQSAQRNVAAVGTSYNTLQRRIAAANRLIAGITLGVGGSNAVATLGNLQNATARLSAVSKTLAADQSFISETSRRMSLDIEAATATMARLRVLQDAGALSAAEVTPIMVGMGDAFARFGADAGQQENVIYGLAQALGQGTVQAQELNQVVEPLPGLLNDIAKAAGLTAGEYRNVIKDGNTLSASFKRDFIGAIQAYAGTAEKLEGNIRQTLTRMSNAYKETLLVFNEPITGGIAVVAQGITSVLQVIADNAPVVAQSLSIVSTAVVAAFGAKALNAVGSFTNRFVADVATRIKARIAEVEAYSVVAAQEKRIAAVAKKQNADKLVQLKQEEAALIGRQRLARATAVDDARAATIKRQVLAIEKEFIAASAANAAIETKQNAAVLAAQQQRLKGQIDLSKANVATARTDAARLQRNATLSTQLKELATTEKALAVAISQRDVAAAKALRTEAATAAATAKVAAAQKLQLAAKRELIALDAGILASQTSLNAAVAAQAASTGLLQRSTEAAAAQVTALTLRQRAYVVATRAGAAVTKLFTGATALIGGPTGVALLAAYGIYTLYQRLKISNAEFDASVERTEKLNAAMKVMENQSRDAGDSIVSATDKLREQAKELRENAELWRTNANEAAKSLSFLEQLALGANVRVPGFNPGEFIADRDTLRADKIEAQALAEERAEFVTDYAESENRLRDALNNSSAANEKYYKTLADGGKKAVESTLTQFTQIAALKQKIVDIDRAIRLSGGRFDDTDAEAAKRRIREQIANLDGTTQRLKDQADVVKKMRDERDRLLESYQTEEEKLDALLAKTKSFVAADRISQAPVLTVPEGEALLIKAEQDRNRKIIKLVRDRIKEEVDAEREKLDTLTSFYEEEAQKRKEVNDRLLAARAVVDPLGNAEAVNASKLTALLNEKDATLNIEKNYLVLREALEIESANRIAAARAQVEAKAAKDRNELFKTSELAAGAQVLTNFLSAAQRDVGQYIRIRKDMTDAEKAEAQASKKINEKRFEKNKRLQKAAALINTAVAVTKTIADLGYFGIPLAASVAALGYKQVRAIDNESFADVSSSGSSGFENDSTNPNDERRNTQTSGNVIVIVGDSRITDSEAIDTYNNLLPDIQKAADENKIFIKDDKLTTSDAQFIRRRAATA